MYTLKVIKQNGTVDEYTQIRSKQEARALAAELERGGLKNHRFELATA